MSLRRLALLLALSACTSTAPAASTQGTAPAHPDPAAGEEDEEIATAPDGGAAIASDVKPGGPITALDAIVRKDTPRSAFPSSSSKDADCYKNTPITGQAESDYSAIVAKCGAPTGMIEFARKAKGAFDANHRHDTFSVKLLANYCYRVYAIGDQSVGELNIRVQKPGGALIAMAGSHYATAIIDPDKAWCKKHDDERQFVVEAPKGNGAYVFAVWARPR
jgi:hypothetical protein